MHCCFFGKAFDARFVKSGKSRFGCGKIAGYDKASQHAYNICNVHANLLQNEKS